MAAPGGSDARDLAHRLLRTDSPADAVACYYAWWHPGSRIHLVEQGRDSAILVDAQGSHGPVGILRATDPALVAQVLARPQAGRRYLMTKASLAQAVRASVRVQDADFNRIHHLPSKAPVWSPPAVGELRRAADRAEVVVGGERVAECTLLWRSPHFAELAVGTRPGYRGRGLASTCVGAMAEALLESAVQPIYVASIQNPASLRVAEAAGFVPWPELEFAGRVAL